MRTARSMAGSSLLRPPAAVVALAALVLAGCASFPKPSSGDDSLFVLLSENPAPRAGLEQGPGTLRFDGPTPFQISPGGEESRGCCVRVKPGRYTLTGPVPDGIEAGAGSAFDVPPGAVFLYPLKFTRRSESRLARIRRLVPLSPQDQRTASALLTDYFDYDRWLDRVMVGFGASPPRLAAEEGDVAFDISSTPPGAQVTVDGRGWGVTPVTTTLRTGTHLLRLEIPGVAYTETTLDVRSRGEINVSLPVSLMQEAKPAGAPPQKIAILLTAFQNMGAAENDNLKVVFAQVIGSNMRNDPRLVLVDGGEVVAQGTGIPGRPDFALARKKGMDLIVSGYYTARADGLLVYAALYDVRTQIVRASIVYTGRPGLAMLDSIDAMSAELLQGVDKALPEALAPLRREEGTAQSRIVSYDKKRTDAAIVQNRRAKKSSLSLLIGPSMATVGGVIMPDFPAILLAVLPLGIGYDYRLGGPLSLAASLRLALAYDKDSYASRPYVDVPLRVGPEYTLSLRSTDFTFGLLGEIRFTQALFDSDEIQEFNSVWITGLALETAVRLYLQSRMSERPSYLLFGFSWFIIGAQTDFDLTSPRFAPVELSLTLGYGLRL